MPARRTELEKHLRGTSRNDRAPKRDGAQRLLTPPKPPVHMAPRARAEWRRLAPAVLGLGTLTTADLRAFELLAQTLATATEAMEALAESGLSVPTADGGLKPHPCVRIMETARSQAKALLSDFGLTPRGRQGIDTHPISAAGASPFDEFADPNPFIRFRGPHG